MKHFPLVFISMFPNLENEQEGTMQRAKSIDALVQSKRRVYLDISVKRHFKSLRTVVSDDLEVLHLNFWVHGLWIAWYVAVARLVYVHSVYNALYIVFLYFIFGHKIITDMHGVVPEELKMAGRSARAFVYGRVELIVVKYSSLLITVSENMSVFFARKYYHISTKNNFLKLPILNYSSYDSGYKGVVELQKPLVSELLTVYAGGVQIWQKIETMLGVIQKLKVTEKYSFALYVPSNALPFLRKELDSRHINQVVLDSLSHRELLLVYREAHLGFLLRDDIVINQVAMPTKAIEYLEHGIVPIVLSSNIGDLLAYGYKYILVDDLVSGTLVSHSILETMRQTNFCVAQNIRADAEAAKLKLVKYFDDSMADHIGKMP